MHEPPEPPTPDVTSRSRRQVTWRELPGQFPVTFGIALLTLVFFGLEAWFGGTMDHAAQMRLGALRSDRILEDLELYRLFMPMLLHHGLFHLTMNGLAYVQLMLLTEHLFGPVRALLFYVLSGVGAALATTFFAPEWIGGSVGASGAILGLAGLLLGSSWYGREPWRGHLRMLFGRRLFTGVVLTFVIGVGLTFVMPIVDNWGHAGGFVTGLLLALFHRDPRKREGTLARTGAGLLAAAWMLSIGWTAFDGHRILPGLPHDQAALMARRAELQGEGTRAGVYLMEMVRAYHRAGTPDEGQRVLQDHLERLQDPQTVLVLVVQLYDASIRFEPELELALERWVELAPDEPEALNALAWHLVTRAVDRREPARAEGLVQRALDAVGAPVDKDGRRQRAAYLDTKAEALFQLGRLPEAFETQTEAVELAETEGMAELPSLRERLTRIEKALARD